MIHLGKKINLYRNKETGQFLPSQTNDLSQHKIISLENKNLTVKPNTEMIF